MSVYYYEISLKSYEHNIIFDPIIEISLLKRLYHFAFIFYLKFIIRPSILVYLTWNIYFRIGLSFLFTNRLNKLNTHLFLNILACANCTHNNDSMNTSQITMNICLISLYNNKQYGHLYDNYLHRGCAW